MKENHYSFNSYYFCYYIDDTILYLIFVREVGFLFKVPQCIHLPQSHTIVEFDCTIPPGVSPKYLTTTFILYILFQLLH